jgi:hypothetical protein
VRKGNNMDLVIDQDLLENLTDEEREKMFEVELVKYVFEQPSR